MYQPVVGALLRRDGTGIGAHSVVVFADISIIPCA